MRVSDFTKPRTISTRLLGLAGAAEGALLAVRLAVRLVVLRPALQCHRIGNVILTRVLDCVTDDHLVHVKDARRVTAAGGASAVPAGEGSSPLLPGGSGISLPAL